MSRNNAFITLKDHKPNFLTDTKCRLIKLAKSEMGKISSNMLKETKSTNKLDMKQGSNSGDLPKKHFHGFRKSKIRIAMNPHNWTL